MPINIKDIILKLFKGTVLLICLAAFTMPLFSCDDRPYARGCVYGYKKGSLKDKCIQRTPKFYWGRDEGKTAHQALVECERYLRKQYNILSREKNIDYIVPPARDAVVYCSSN